MVETMREMAHRARRNALGRYKSYAKRCEFHEAGKTARERLFSAGNQLGKTYSGAAETAMHLTGRYPTWWKGKVFEKATSGWSASVTSELTHDGVQRLLLGRPGVEAEFGTAAIPLVLFGKG